MHLLFVIISHFFQFSGLKVNLRRASSSYIGLRRRTVKEHQTRFDVTVTDDGSFCTVCVSQSLMALLSAGHVVERLSIDKIRFFRVERTYAVKTGKWYFEFEAVTGGDMRVGWARPGCKPDVELGTDDQAYVFDGHRVSWEMKPFRPVQTGSSDCWKRFETLWCWCGSHRVIGSTWAAVSSAAAGTRGTLWAV